MWLTTDDKGASLTQSMVPMIQNDDQKQSRSKHKSCISKICCQNLAGMTTTTTTTDNRQRSDEISEIVLTLDPTTTSSDDGSPNLVAITGETGSGKSLLIARVAELVTGGKASTSFLDPTAAASNRPATVEMTLSLRDDKHVSMVTATLNRYDLDAQQILDSSVTTTPQLRLKRILTLTPNGQRVKSICFLNDHPVTLKVLKAVGAPLVAIVNAPAAAAALGRPASRLLMIDSGVPSSVLVWVRQLQFRYQKCKRHRQALEQELANQNLPVTMKRKHGKTTYAPDNLQDGQDDRDLELLRHWVEELNGFEARMCSLRDSLCAADGIHETESGMGELLAEMEVVEWITNEGTGGSFSSSFYRMLLDLMEEIKSLDEKISLATRARDTLSSLSSSDSAYTALNRARKLLLEATNGMEGRQSKVVSSAEQTHQLLNQVEDALLECGSFLDDEKNGLVASLQDSRRRCPVSAEKLLECITEWNTLARKHGISSYQLPSCHSSLQQELDGGIEARIQLPIALKAEKEALDALKEGCMLLTTSRSALCERLSKSITQQLPKLGMENSRFEARLHRINNPSYGPSHLGVEEVDFYLKHGVDQNAASAQEMEGKLEAVASSGEKARILLSIECLLPGSVRALCGTQRETDEQSGDDHIAPPVAVVYDEIDAHVGGRALMSVAQMLVEQAKSCQVLSITHSPSLAALASTHICVSKGQAAEDKHPFLCAVQVEGTERQKELARMASGDMASEEAELFAKALLRDASLNPMSKQNNTVISM
jgi:DNA repair ATPase RecN